MEIKSIVESIHFNSLKNPDNSALVFGSENYSYEELICLAGKLSQGLLSRQEMIKNNRVGIYLKNSSHLPVAILSALSQHITYIPLATLYPAQRIQAIMADAECNVIITNHDTQNKYPLKETGLELIYAEDLLAETSLMPPRCTEHHENDTAYIMYTSGSTGTPKGVKITHQNLNYYVNWFNKEIRPLTQTRLPLTSSPAFAASILQMFSSLVRGETLHVLPEELIIDPGSLLEWYTKHPHSALYCVPSVWAQILEYSRAHSCYLLPSAVYLSGEPISENLKNLTFQTCPACKVYNLYGPTEATGNGAWSELFADEKVTAGKALSGSEIAITDSSGAIQPTGAEGEIVILGPGIAQGYLNRAELTDQVFFTNDRGVRGYRTGDLGKIDPRGNLICLGRIDRQIKISGVRIEPADIESVLCQHPEIAQAVVTGVTVQQQLKIIAWVVPRSSALELKTVRDFLKVRLPVTMIPAYIQQVERLPVLANGKIDTKMLPAPDFSRSTLELTEREFPVSDLEKEMCELWQSSIGVGSIGMNERFLDLGGNSLQLMQLRHRIEQQFCCSLDSELLHANSTINTLLDILPYYSHAPVAHQQEQLLYPHVQLSSQQEYFLTLQYMTELIEPYQIHFCLEFNGSVSSERVKSSLHKLVTHNGFLFASDEKLVNEIFSPTTAGFFEYDTLMVNKTPDNGWLNYMEGSLKELTKARFQWIQTGESKLYLLCSIHHAFFDHDSINSFVKHLSAAYNNPALLPGTVGPSDEYITNQCQNRNPASKQAYIDFWRGRLRYYRTSGAVACQSAAMDIEKCDAVTCYLGRELSGKIKRKCIDQQINPFIYFLTIYFILLQSDAVNHHSPIGIPVTDRYLKGQTDAIGCFVSMTVFYLNTPSTANLEKKLKDCQSKFYQLMEYQDYSYSEIINELRNNANAEYFYFSHCFNFLSDYIPPQSIEGGTISAKEIQSNYARSALTLNVQDGENYELKFIYLPEEYSTEKINIIQNKYIKLLESL